MSKKVYYKGNEALHTISFINDENKAAVIDKRSRWAYIIVSKRDVKEILSGEEKTKEEILDKLENHYKGLLSNSIYEEEKETKNYESLKDKYYEVSDKLIIRKTSNNYITPSMLDLLKIQKYYKEVEKLRIQKIKEKKEKNISTLKIKEDEVKNHLKKENARFKKAKEKDLLKPYAVIAMPYVYNYEDNKNIKSKLKATFSEKYITSSLLDAYQIEGKWCDPLRNEKKQMDLSNEDSAYFHIQTLDIEDGTKGILTLKHKNTKVFENIDTLKFQIINNEAFVEVKLSQIKFKLLDALGKSINKVINSQMDDVDFFDKYIKQAFLKLFFEVDIKDYEIKKDLAEDRYLKVYTNYIKIGVKSLDDLPYLNSMPEELTSTLSALGEAGSKVGKFLKYGERVLDKLNVELIHEHISFRNDENLGFTKFYNEKQIDERKNSYGMIKTDKEMREDNPKASLNDYSWDKFYCDEDTIKEAIYQTINDHKYAVTDTVAMMNESDLLKNKTQRGEKDDFNFTPITRYTPQKGKKYSLTSENCQTFVERIRRKYKTLEQKAKKEEKL